MSRKREIKSRRGGHARRFLACLAFLAAAGIAGRAQAETELIVNGGFETGDLSGWTVTNFGQAGGGEWTINDGTFDPPFGPGEAISPISGSFDALSHQRVSGVRVLSQAVPLPPGIGSAVLRWSDRIRNHAPIFHDPAQEFRVVIRDDSGALLMEVFSTNPGDPLQQAGPNARAFDVTALAQSFEGRQIVIGFEEQDTIFFFNVSVDDASLVVGTDSDLDGVPDLADACPGTVIPESVPAVGLGVNRFALVDGDDVFDTASPYGEGPRRAFTLRDTAGCSCEQIIRATGAGKGHARFGCSIGLMEEWIGTVGR